MAIRTADDPVTPNFRSNRLLQGLAALYGAVWVAAAIRPVDRFDWFLENLLIFAAAAGLAATWRRWPLSDLSYILITLFLALHTIGAHYTYAKVPLGFWVQDALGLERNHFDRLIHFGFGLLIVYPVRELFLRYAGTDRGWAGFGAFAVIVCSSAVFEIIEWVVAIIVSPEAAMAYLGTQGDVFDAQKDSAFAIIGAWLGLVALRTGQRTVRKR